VLLAGGLTRAWGTDPSLGYFLEIGRDGSHLPFYQSDFLLEKTAWRSKCNLDNNLWIDIGCYIPAESER
jgi:hypothetical protein